MTASKTTNEPKKERRVRRKTTGAEIAKLAKAGDSVEGYLTDMSIKHLHSPKTRTTEPTRMYHFRRDDDTRFILTGRDMLDDQFDEIAMAENNGKTIEEDGLGNLRNAFFRIERGEDKTTNAGNTLGTYEVTMFDE